MSGYNVRLVLHYTWERRKLITGAGSYEVAPYGSDLYPHSHNKRDSCSYKMNKSLSCVSYRVYLL